MAVTTFPNDRHRFARAHRSSPPRPRLRRQGRSRSCEGVRGRFLLRHEDIDSSACGRSIRKNRARSSNGSGLDWDSAPLRQSTRQPAYEAALEHLKTRELVYPCSGTRKDIQAALSAPHGSEKTTYPGICRAISPAAAKKQIAAGATHAWRFDSGKAAELHGDLFFEDLRFGTTQVDPIANGDAVLAEKTSASPTTLRSWWMMSSKASPM